MGGWRKKPSSLRTRDRNSVQNGGSKTQQLMKQNSVDKEKIQEWVEQFDKDGFLFLEEVLPTTLVAELKEDLERSLRDGVYKDSAPIRLKERMFETSPSNLRLFDLEPMVSFAEAVLGDSCHVMHNNSFETPPGGGITGWHQDDPPHYLVTHGDPPTNVRLPCLLFTANYYLTDVTDVNHGPTECVCGSHLFGRPCPENPHETQVADRIVPCLGPAGSVVIFNNQVWHHGRPNESERTRGITQVSYGRRIIGHKYHPFMNYVMPEHVYADAGPRLKRLLGFLPKGAYG